MKIVVTFEPEDEADIKNWSINGKKSDREGVINHFQRCTHESFEDWVHNINLTFEGFE